MGAPASQENLNVWAPTTDGFSVMAAHYHIIVVVLSNFSVYQNYSGLLRTDYWAAPPESLIQLA